MRRLDRQSAKLAAQASYSEGGKDLAQAVQTLIQINPGQEGLPSLDAVFIPDDANVVAAIAKEIAATPLAHVHLLGTNILQTPATLQYADASGRHSFSGWFFCR